MFESVLIANRGEIACRISRTLRALGARVIAVYSDADRKSRHVREADLAIRLGPAPARESYLNAERVLMAARESGAQAIHPGYGFLSENADFAQAVEAAGLAFIGPTPDQIRAFGIKHRARELAERAGVPLLPGSGALDDLSHAVREAERVGFPVMLKSSAGGGGIGMQLVREPAALPKAYESVRFAGRSNFGNAALFLERFVEHARHIEVQVFGDGAGAVVTLGERDCSAQRRNQKVIEEAPAPNLPRKVREALHGAARELLSSVSYRSAGTVEFIYDAECEQFYFLEVNTRLQVEHGVTELVRGIDLVEWMVRTAAGDAPDLASLPRESGHAIEVRLYAEDPAREFRPSSGLLTQLEFPQNARVDTFLEVGDEVASDYDPMLAKIMAHGADRDGALSALESSLAETRIGGIRTNLDYLKALLTSPTVRQGRVLTRTLPHFAYADGGVEIIAPGTFSILVDYPGRTGYWSVGVPPSGPMDDWSARIANGIVGNPEDCAVLEMTHTGATLRFSADQCIALTGARMRATLDGKSVSYGRPLEVRAGQVLQLGSLEGGGQRSYLAIRGGFDVPSYLGSRTTFTLGGFGGHAGRCLRKGDVLFAQARTDLRPVREAPIEFLPAFGKTWEIRVMYGPHGAPEFFTRRDIDTLFSAEYEVHYNSSRTGVRLLGPKPEWARPDGGEAGLHPSNIHDVAYAIGAIDFTGDMPILLGPDGPSLGGFVCPATIPQAELWKMGQLHPGDRVRFIPIALETALTLEHQQRAALTHFPSLTPLPAAAPNSTSPTQAPAPTSEAQTPAPTSQARAPDPSQAGLGPRAQRGAPWEGGPAAGGLEQTLQTIQQTLPITIRPAGDRYLLVEYGPLVLDLRLRFRVHALMTWLERASLPGVLDLTPGVRSLQIHYDPARLPAAQLRSLIERAEDELGDASDVAVPTRTVWLPLSWDDPETRRAIEKYTQLVRADAPWCPSNIEFIRRINGLADERAVYDTVFNASYLVLGLGDVYLGAPVATPLDPRHRLVTTKYNPARTWTPENAVGIGGAYMCIYGMEGPGGYQFVGRTLQVYNRFRTTPEFAPGTPWLLRFFDQIRFYPVSAKELLELRESFLHGAHSIRIEPGTFRLSEYQTFLEDNQRSIALFKAQQQRAFEAERARWAEQALAEPSEEASISAAVPANLDALPEGVVSIDSHVTGSIWKLAVERGARVKKGDVLVVLESMKMEISVEASHDGTVTELSVGEGRAVSAGQRLMLIEQAEAS
ncbi:MAG TPA: 5-oxoprolinase/urea amidolyase family protein [Polyangiaceae bacterium]|nr:5-oxoprolinase/urea amidolyase family protein [Polyangiaceae bacterium]